MVDEIIAAAVRGDVLRVEELLANGPELAAKSNIVGSTAIHAAHYSGHAAVSRLLWDAANLRLDVFLAAQLGLVGELRQMLDADPSIARAFDGRGATALHGACYWGSVAAVDLLIQRGADVNAPTTDGFLQIAPLGSAVATPDVPNPSQDEDVVLKLVDRLLDAGADVNFRRRDGMTALHSAAYRGHLMVIRRLIERGADPTLRAYESGFHANQSPLDTAVSQQQHAAAALLNQFVGQHLT